MHEQIGWRGLWRNIKHEAPLWAAMLPTLPRKLNDLVSQNPVDLMVAGYQGMMWEQKKRNWLLAAIVVLLATLVATLWWR